jgi:hypothetical protein
MAKSKKLFILCMILAGAAITNCPAQNTQIPKSPNCQPPTQAFLKQIATNIISKDPKNAIWYPLALKNAKLTQFELIKGKFSGKGKEEYLAVLKSGFYAGMMTQTKGFDLLLKLGCTGKDWTVDWYTQTYAITKEAVKDINGDGIDELLIKAGDAKLGIMRYSTKIISIKNNQANTIYQNRILSYAGTGPSITDHLHSLDTLSIEPSITFKDVNNDQINEIIENTKVEVYAGGKTYETIMAKAKKTSTKRVLYLINGKYQGRKSDHMQRIAKTYYQLLDMGDYARISSLFAPKVKQWIISENIDRKEVGKRAQRFLSTKKGVFYKPNLSLAQTKGNTLILRVKLGWNSYQANVTTTITFNNRCQIISLQENAD